MVNLRRQHHQHADKPDRHGGPAVDAHALLEQQSRERHADQRRGKRDGIGFDQGQPRQRAEIAEHADDAERAAAGLAERAFGAHCGHELAAPGIDQNHRHNGEGRSVEHHFANRITDAEITDQRRHHGEENRRNQLKQNALAGVHVQLSRTAYGFFGGGLGPCVGGSAAM
jgi:hypothetical protein